MTDGRDQGDIRDPLSSIPLNTPQRINALAGPSKHTPPSTTSKPTPSSSTKKLAPIFLTKRRTPTSSTTKTTEDENTPPNSGNGSPISRKRIRLDPPSSIASLTSIPLENTPSSSSSSASSGTSASTSHGIGNSFHGSTLDVEMDGSKNHFRMHSIHDWFLPSTNLNYERVKEGKKPEIDTSIRIDAAPSNGVWKRQRKRLGVKSMNSLTLSSCKLITTQPPFLSTLVHSLLPYDPVTPPSVLLLPSLHPPTGRPRDFAPPLSISFNHVAKTYDSYASKELGLRRLIAIAGEEGGVRILNVDEGLGTHREEKGFWWRAHGNAVFDLKWSKDDSKVLTASGDQSTRLHALTTPTPTLLATLTGHTSSVKTTTFFDPSRSQSDPSSASSVIASGGRDGNILIYDVRCRGRRNADADQGPVPRGDRERYSDGVPGFVAQPPSRGIELNPVMTIRNAHGDGRRNGISRTSTRSVTSLVALQSMPGVLASGGSYDGIVKLWDLRFPAPTTRSPEPRPSCTAMGSLPDPTVHTTAPSRRARSINALCESPTTGDLFALCGDSKIHSLRPSHIHSIASGESSDAGQVDMGESIGIKTYTDSNLLVSSFYIRLSISSDGRYLSSGSCKGGVMTWDTKSKNTDTATRLSLGEGGVHWPAGKEREVGAVDWGKDMLAASSDDLATRIWRSNREAAKWLRDDPVTASEEWGGSIV